MFLKPWPCATIRPGTQGRGRLVGGGLGFDGGGFAAEPRFERRPQVHDPAADLDAADRLAGGGAALERFLRDAGELRGIELGEADGFDFRHRRQNGRQQRVHDRSHLMDSPLRLRRA